MVWLVRVVSAIVIPITHPNTRNAFIIFTSIVVSRAFRWWAWFLVFTIGAISLFIASLFHRNTKSLASHSCCIQRRFVCKCSIEICNTRYSMQFIETSGAFELLRQTGVIIAKLLIWFVFAIVISVTNLTRKDTSWIVALKLSWSARELRTIWWLIRSYQKWNCFL